MRIAPLMILSLLGYGCAVKKMAASSADIVLEHQIQKRLHLYSAQKDLLSKDVKTFLNDQKAFAKEAIPIITSLELDVKKVDEHYDYLQKLYRKLALNFSKLMSKHMALLDSKQQKDFAEVLRSENNTMARSKSNDRMETIEERFETLFGVISDKQKKILEAKRAYFEERHKVRLSRREKLQQRFSEIFLADVSPESRANLFYEAFAEYQTTYPENAMNLDIIKSIIPTLSPGQKEVFEDKTNDLKDILNYYLETDY
jgi:hypothetical protein